MLRHIRTALHFYSAAFPVTMPPIAGLLFCGMLYEQFTYPQYDAPLIEAYDGRFEAALILLHPFVRVPEHLAWKTTQEYPADEQILARGSKCTWAEVAEQSGLNNCSKINQALLTSIGSLQGELSDYEGRDKLKNFLEAESVWMPTEGRFEPLLQNDILATFEASGKDELVFVPEFPGMDPIGHLKVADLRSRLVTFPERGSLVADDASFLFTVDWDSFFTMLYGPRKFIDKVARKLNLEGFFANVTQDHLWFNYSMGCATVTISPEHWPVAE
jgi:hypothetical protein